MKINELRYGNLIFISKSRYPELTDVPCKVVAIVGYQNAEEGVLTVEPTNGQEIMVVNSRFIHPIPITEEVLLMAGFLNGCKGLPKIKSTMVININGQNTICVIKENNSYIKLEFSIWGSDAKHLHDLQNLWFSLTGEELTFNKTVTNE